MTHWREFMLEEQDDPAIPENLFGQIVLHLNDGNVVSYQVSATGKPKDRNGVVDLSEARRLTGNR